MLRENIYIYMPCSRSRPYPTQADDRIRTNNSHVNHWIFSIYSYSFRTQCNTCWEEFDIWIVSIFNFFSFFLSFFFLRFCTTQVKTWENKGVCLKRGNTCRQKKINIIATKGKITGVKGKKENIYVELLHSSQLSSGDRFYAKTGWWVECLGGIYGESW